MTSTAEETGTEMIVQVDAPSGKCDLFVHSLQHMNIAQTLESTRKIDIKIPNVVQGVRIQALVRSIRITVHLVVHTLCL